MTLNTEAISAITAVRGSGCFKAGTAIGSSDPRRGPVGRSRADECWRCTDLHSSPR